MRKIILAILCCSALSSCVSTKVYNSEKARAMMLESQLAQQKATATGLAADLAALQSRYDKAVADSARLWADNAGLNDSYTALKNRYEQLVASGSAEAARMLRQLEQSQTDLTAREKRVSELEQLLAAREKALSDIRRKVADALLGFEGKGLTITQRDGKVYVSMDDKLLFRSGSWEIDPAGAKAVHDLAGVLAGNPDINVMVEGHTDDVPYKAGGTMLLDNLDLSVKRATTVTRLLLENKGIAPSRITSAGRGEWLPVSVGKTTEARAANRRTEIILTPKLDELMQLM